MTYHIQFEGVNKHYGAYHALKDIDLGIPKGTFVALVGPSGCGKSTLLRSLAGLEKITSGNLTIAGETMNNVPPRKRDLAMVFQSYALYPHMTVEENLTYSLRIRGVAKAEAKKAAEEVAATTGLSELLGRYPRELSGGQRQRVAMSRAIIRHPKAFLFDEPLSNLDAALRVQMRKEIRALHDRLGATSVYVTHDQIEAMTLGTRVAMMSKGSLQQVGRPMDIYMKPANTFVATFIGSPEMALIPCKGARRSGLAHDAFTGPLALGGTDVPDEVLLGVRPEEACLVREGGMARARVLQSELIGAEALVEVQLGDDRMTVRSAVADAPAAGEEIGLDFDLDRARLFHGATGQAIELG
jgi:multiple sugar transport system ATP-binding protein